MELKSKFGNKKWYKWTKPQFSLIYSSIYRQSYTYWYLTRILSPFITSDKFDQTLLNIDSRFQPKNSNRVQSVVVSTPSDSLSYLLITGCFCSIYILKMVWNRFYSGMIRWKSSKNACWGRAVFSLNFKTQTLKPADRSRLLVREERPDIEGLKRSIESWRICHSVQLWSEKLKHLRWSIRGKRSNLLWW